LGTSEGVRATVKRVAIQNPANLEVVEEVDFYEDEDLDAPLRAAEEAQRAWRDRAPRDRARALEDLAQAVREHAEELARLEMAQAGHPITMARGEAQGVADAIAYFAGIPERAFGRQIPVAGGIDVTFREPLGVVGIIVPWNFPMLIATWGFAPAIAAGNAVVLKPAEATPLTALELARLAREVGIPEGVLTVIPGEGPIAGWRLVTDPRVRKVCFTGSTRVGKAIMAGCAEQLKRVTLELGGKSANVIFADADVAAAAAAAPAAVFDNAGQDCCARSRLLVAEEIYEEFMAAFRAAVAKLRVGDPADPATEIGPLISAAQRERVLAYVREARVLFQGSAPDGPGYYVAPTVLDGSDSTAPSWCEEIFGPVVSVRRFRTEEEAIAIVNDSPYGLSGSIWTRDVARALRVARRIESGTLSVNSHSSVRHHTPFGGFKQSGIGRELGPEALEEFTELKNVFVRVEGL
jgi:acyl-CoA reductase-like NAD-dependent aldehyde dehydrogenase